MLIGKYDNKYIGKYIKKLRKDQEKSMYQLAVDSGISNSVLMRVEKGEREPRVNTLLKIIDGLGTTPKEFFNEMN